VTDFKCSHSTHGVIPKEGLEKKISRDQETRRGGGTERRIERGTSSIMFYFKRRTDDTEYGVYDWEEGKTIRDLALTIDYIKKGIFWKEFL